MKLANNRMVNDVGQEFTNAYPFLRIDFFKYVQGRSGLSAKQKLSRSISLANIGIRHEGEMEIIETMTVKQLEQNFLNQFGLFVQVSRKSGSIWLETTISEAWTLKQQNDHGRELSEPIKNIRQQDQIGSD